MFMIELSFNDRYVYNTVKSIIFVGVKFRGFEFNNEFVDI